MRISILAALASLTSAIPTPADACGPYEFQPRAMLVSSHGVRAGDHGWATRTFVQTGGEIPAGTRLAMLAPGTYDGTDIADAQDPDFDRVFTLVGPGATRVVETRARVFLAPAWQGAAGEAFEVRAASGPLVALAGRHASAKWIDLASKEPTAHEQLTFGKSITISFAGAVRVVTSYRDGKSFSTIRPHTRISQDVEGAPIGAFSLGGKQYLVTIQDGHAITTQL